MLSIYFLSGAAKRLVFRFRGKGALQGEERGAVVGGAFGLISFLQCFGIIGSSPLGAALVSYSPVLMFVQRFVSRVLVGVLAGLVFSGMKRTRAPFYVKGLVTGFCSALFNTILFMSLLVILFQNTEYMQNSMAGRGILTYIVASVGINAVVEMAVAAVVTGAVGTALRKAKLLRTSSFGAMILVAKRRALPPFSTRSS